MKYNIAKLIKQCCFLTDSTLVGDKWYRHREWVTWPSGRSVKWFPTAYSSPTLWAERPHPFWGVFMGDIAGVHWRTINRVRCDYCIPSNRLHNSVLVRALPLSKPMLDYCFVECPMIDHVRWPITHFVGHPLNHVDDVMRCFCSIFNYWSLVARAATYGIFLLKSNDVQTRNLWEGHFCVHLRTSHPLR